MEVEVDTPYFCKWTNCDWPGNKDDLVDHIREIHVELQPYQQQRHNWEMSKGSNGLNGINGLNGMNGMNGQHLVNGNTNGFKKSESQQYVCLWEGCKVYGKSSLSRNWLERHALLHSGPRPFKCIVDGCNHRFKTQSALERHVNSHFKPNLDLSCSNSTNNLFEPSTSTSNGILTPSSCSHSDNSSNGSNGGNAGMSPFELHLQQSSHATMIRVKSVNDMNGSVGHNGRANGTFNGNHGNATPNKIFKRKKSQTKLKRKCIIVKCSEDFFDECVMEQVRYGLIQLNAQTGIDISTQTAITFHSKVIARRKSASGEINVLLKWEPNDILPDVWVTEPEVSELKSKSIPISLLPQECLAQLNGEEIKPKIKKKR